MTAALRGLARRLLGVTRTSTYYLPWVVRPPVGCVVLINNIESRFKSDFNHGPFPVSITQYDAGGRIARRYAVTLADSGDTAASVLPTLRTLTTCVQNEDDYNEPTADSIHRRCGFGCQGQFAFQP
ncbi:MAG: hypothetical protein ACRDGM_04695 [bacterium]